MQCHAPLPFMKSYGGPSAVEVAKRRSGRTPEIHVTSTFTSFIPVLTKLQTCVGHTVEVLKRQNNSYISFGLRR